MSFFNSMKWAVPMLGIAVGLFLFGCIETGDNDAGGTLVTVSGSNNYTSGAACKKVTIGTQVWMAENLNIETSESWCYADSSKYCGKYGRLYTWDAAMTACPTGWHLPSNEEWTALVDYVWNDQGTGLGTAASYLKSTSGWGSGNGSDAYGFSALPGGGRYFDNFYFYVDAGNYGYWWTATEFNGYSAFYRQMNYQVIDKNCGFSVRCVGD